MPRGRKNNERDVSMESIKPYLLMLPLLPVDYIFERLSTTLLRRRHELGRLKRVAEGEHDPQVPLRRKQKDLASLFRIVDRSGARANTQLPGRQLHERRGLAGIEHNLETPVRVGRKDGNRQGRAGDVAGPFTAGGQSLEPL